MKISGSLFKKAWWNRERNNTKTENVVLERCPTCNQTTRQSVPKAWIKEKGLVEIKNITGTQQYGDIITS